MSAARRSELARAPLCQFEMAIAACDGGLMLAWLAPGFPDAHGQPGRALASSFIGPGTAAQLRGLADLVDAAMAGVPA